MLPRELSAKVSASIQPAWQISFRMRSVSLESGCCEPVQSTGAAGETFEVVVPADASPGDILTLTTQTGQRMKVVVPEGAEPGDTLTLAMTTQ